MGWPGRAAQVSTGRDTEEEVKGWIAVCGHGRRPKRKRREYLLGVLEGTRSCEMWGLVLQDLRLGLQPLGLTHLNPGLAPVTC